MLRTGSSVILRALMGCFLCFFVVSPSWGQVIYDNTSTFLGSFVSERREYGDQLDLGGVARRLTQIQFEHYGRFATNGDEAVKVRLYTNEKKYDLYRKEPTTLLYESDWMPIQPGYRSRLIDGLNVLLPMHTVTFTVEFAGIAADEEAGLLFYGPPTEGYSFNEFWVRSVPGLWVPVLYSTTDPNRRANVSLRLIATPDVRLDQQQSVATTSAGMQQGTGRVQLAQTFTAATNGLLSHFVLNVSFTNGPLRLRLLDALNGMPGPNVLASRNILSGGGTNQNISMTAFNVFLQTGKQYAIELSAPEEGSVEETRVAAAAEIYSGGTLWSRNETGGIWAQVMEEGASMDAMFQVHVTPAEPSVEMLRPRPFELFDVGEPITMRAQVRSPEIATIAKVRFMRGTQELGVVTNAPYEFVWTNALSGEQNLRAIAEDSFRRPFRSLVTTVNVRPNGAPVNDLFARRIELEGLNLRRMKPTGRATVELNEPGLSAINAGATVWWSWTAWSDAPVTISAQHSSSPGARVVVFRGSAVTGLNVVASGTSGVRFEPLPGVKYAISVDPAIRGDLVVLDLFVTLPELKIDRLMAEGGRLGLGIWSLTNRPVRVEYSSDLVSWERGAELQSTAAGTTWSQARPGGVEKRFYRLVAE